MWKGLKGASTVVLGFDGVVLIFALVAGSSLASTPEKWFSSPIAVEVQSKSLKRARASRVGGERALRPAGLRLNPNLDCPQSV